MLLSRRGTRSRAFTGLVALPASLLLVLSVTNPADAANPANAATGSSAEQPAAKSGGLWTATAQRPAASHDGHVRSVNPSSFRAYALAGTAMTGLLAQAPMEDTPAANRGGATTVQVPGPTGELIDFAVVESPVMEADLQAENPEIRTYAGRSVTDGYDATIRLDTTPLGFHASVIGGDMKAWYVDPAYVGDTSLYLSYWGDALPAPEKRFVEPELDQRTESALKEAAAPRVGAPGAAVTRREYRLALVSDPSYATFYSPSSTADAVSDPLVLAAKTTLMNRVNQIYGDDVAVRMLLVNGTDKLNFQTTTEATGTNGPCGGSACYSSTDMQGCGDVIDTNPHVLAKLIGAENYDIGHIMFGEAGDGGGVAYLGVVGEDEYKGGGCTGLANPVGDGFAIDYVAHEMGHQFNGDHTFNGSKGSCAGNGEASAAVEPGSGSSVQAYAGICRQDDLQPHTDPYFSQKSQDQITSHITGAANTYSEVQEFGLTGYGAGEAFKLDFGGTQTANITSGTNYTAAGIKTAVEGAIGGTVTASSVTANGFTLTYSGAKAGTNIVNPTVVVASGSFSGVGGDYRKGGPGTNQGTQIVTANHNPAVTAPALGTKTIPFHTPFTLTGSGVDSDGDTLNYLWEQNNPGTGSSTLGAHAKGPLFRVFGKFANVTAANTLLYNSPGENAATTSPSRTFPDIEQIVANETNAEASCASISETTALPDNAKLRCHSEYLPDATYQATNLGGMVFRLTARDQVATGGGTDFKQVTVNVSPTIGPFLVTSPNTAVSYAGNSSQAVTWSNTTSSLSANVKISLSTDGGLTYPTVLSASTPNDGSETVTIPNTATTTARIKVEAVENYFFDISNTNFTITNGGAAGLQVTQPGNPTQSAQYSDPIASVGFSATTDQPGGVLAASIDAATPLPAGLSLSARSGTDTNASWTITGTANVAPGSYGVTAKVTDGTSTTNVPLTFTVTQENATPTYTGDTSKTSAAGQDHVNVNLAATVTQAADGSLGDLANATATFVDTTTASTLCSSPVSSGGAASCTYNAAAPGTYHVKVNIGGRFTGTTAADTTLTVSAGTVAGLQVTPPPAAVSTQYSDGVTASFSATSDRPGAALSATPSGLPAGLSLSQSGTPSAASWMVVGHVSGAKGSYPATISVTDGTQTTDVPLQVTVSAEDAQAAYTGPTSATVATPASPTVDVTLTGTITASSDGTPGDITTATADFVDITTSTTLCDDVAVTGSGGDGTASCPLTAEAGRTYDIRVVAGGRYTGTSVGPTLLVVHVPSASTTPDTTLASGPGAWLLSTSATFSFGSSVPGSTFTCTLDGVAAPCTSPYTVNGLSQATHVMSIAATNGGLTDATPVTSTFTVPVDDAALKATRGWKRGHDASAYLGTFTKTHKKKQALTYKISGARALALVVGTSPKSGKLKVFVGHKLVGKVKLKGAKAGSVLVVLKPFAGPLSGKVRIVSTSKKTVRVEGLGVATSLS